MNYIIQSILFKKPEYNKTNCIKWLKKHNFKYNDIDEKENHYRFRQINPEYIKKKGYTHFINKKINPLIEYIIAYPEGVGIFGNIYNKSKNIVSNIIHGRRDYPPSVKKILEKYGNEKIINIELHRIVLPSLYNGILNFWTQNEINERLKNEPKDKLFHISMWIKLNNNIILCEKNEVINFKLNPNRNKDEETKEIRIPNNITFYDFIENGRKYIGDDKFFSYSAKNNNCGNWIEYILKANNINDIDTENFIGQDIDKILEGFPILRKTLNTVTDTAARANVILEGGTIYKNKSNGLYSDQIKKILDKHNYNINGVYSKDELPNNLKLGWYIINLQNHNEGGGTHWTCFLYNPNEIEYFDAFGFPPPIEILNKTKGEIIYNNKEIQDKNSTCCGWFCIGAIISNDFNKYLSMFSNNTDINDIILSKFLISKGFD